MLVDIAIKNYLSFKDEVVFSLLATKSVKELQETDMSNVLSIGDYPYQFLKSAVIYGANGSGKSNLIRAIVFFRDLVVNSFNVDTILRGFSKKQFLFSEGTDSKSAFEMTFIIGDVKYRYGFEISNESINSEWLFKQNLSPSSKESYCFKRIDGDITCNSKTFKTPKEAKEHTRNNALFLSTCALFSVQVAQDIKRLFENEINVMSGINDDTVSYTARQLMNDEVMHKRIIDFMKIADFGIEDISAEETLIEKASDIKNPILRKLLGDEDYENSPNESKIMELNISSFHNKYNSEDKITELVPIPFRSESVGTIKTFAMIGPLLDSLLNGKILIIDEFGASIHTKLAYELLRLFHSKLNNGSQLIITTHDTNLLRKDLFRRDQIWFVEKNKQGGSDLYSLVEYKINQACSVRNDASFSRDYLSGKYGAIPHFGDLLRFIEDYGKEQV